jgi:serine/threonine protein kinase/Tfp pilus assembly protein PilF
MREHSVAPRIGTTVFHYRILEQIGSGGMGVVYKAEDLKLGRRIALKFLPPELTRDPDAKARFIQEARAASSIQHKNICVVHDIDETEDGLLFICMELLDGKTLRERIEDGPLPLDECIQITSQVAEALERAHAGGIVHRDIKPANIIITVDGTVKILDFGLAKVAGRGLQTKAGAALGTVAYMSPEQTLGESVDHRTDLWSLGVVLYEMLTGRRPFGGEYDQATLYAIVHEQHQPAGRVRADAPAGLEQIIDRCLEKSPASRYADAGAVIEALRTIGQKEHVQRPAVTKSIAVLTFTDISMEQDNRYFSDGLTEEIIAKLSRLRTMKVISRTSVMQYERAGKSMKQIAADLGVQYVLEGSVRKHGSELRITTQLIDAGQDSSLWGETYNGSMDEIFEIQEHVASRIVKALKVRLTPDEKRSLRRRPTEDTEAFQLYLKGRYFWGKRSEDGLKTAIRCFKEAIDKDPRYARAWAGLADAYNLLAEYVGASRKDTNPLARAAAERALAFDNGLAEAHTSLASILMLSDWDWSGAEREFKLALSLDPNYATAHHWWAEWLSYHGRNAEALQEMSRAAELDPLSPAILKDKGMLKYYARDYDSAIALARKALELDEQFAAAHRLLSLAYQGKGLFSEAVMENQQWGALTGNGPEATVALAQCHAVAGKREDAIALVKEFSADTLSSGNLCRALALVYAGLGEIDAGLSWLERAFEKGADALTTMKIDPKLDPLRGNPRFAALLERIGLAK